MVSKGHALSRDALVKTLTSYQGITTADGAFDGTATLIDSNLIGRNDFISEKTILIMSGDAKDEDKGATAFDNTDGKITLQGTGFKAQIKKGTVFRVLNISTTEIDVANINSKIGTSGDAAGVTTLFAWLLKLFEHGGQGGFYYGKVTQIDDATHFRLSVVVRAPRMPPRFFVVERLPRIALRFAVAVNAPSIAFSVSVSVSPPNIWPSLFVVDRLPRIAFRFSVAVKAPSLSIRSLISAILSWISRTSSSTAKPVENAV